MSRFNGDKARFNRERKQNIHRRQRTRELLQAAGLSVAKPEASKKPRGISERPAS
ncbi:MAG: hypothetical protein WA637_25175 [Terriglobales bacterium]